MSRTYKKQYRSEKLLKRSSDWNNEPKQVGVAESWHQEEEEYLKWRAEEEDVSQTIFASLTQALLAESPHLKACDIYIHWHSAVSEFCLYIKGKWSGYVEP